MVVGLVVVGALTLGGFWIADRRAPSDLESAQSAAATAGTAAAGRHRPAAGAILSEDELDRLPDVVGSVLRDDATAAAQAVPDATGWNVGPAYVVLRRGGLALAEAWGEGHTGLEAVLAATEEARSLLGPEHEPDAVDAVEIAVSHSFEDIDLHGESDAAKRSNAHRGVWGLELTHGDERVLISPTTMVATNRDFEGAAEEALEELASSSPPELDDVQARRFQADQAVVLLDGSPRVHRMERGNTYVPVEAVTRGAVETLVEDMGDWLERAVHDDGRMTYKYWPSRGAESSANNMIRQWMATTALGRVAAAEDSEELWALSRRNIAYNLEHFYEEEDGLGLIVEDGSKVKLGAVALAGRALVEHRDRRDYAAEEAALLRMVDHLWREDGSFETWYRPASRGGQANFYPGEALYLWSAVYARSQEPEILRRFMRSFRYYRAWHLDPDNRNPAFVPWHTQAYYEVWQVTKDPELAAFVLVMNDWLLGVQQWDGALYRDTKGRFYDPDRPQFGVPHASSTGVYLEGLVDAFRLAQELGEHDRAEAYRRAIVRGLRSVLQLQFTDDVDMYYISQRGPVDGGVRTEVYDNEIRVDNVQHTLMAALKVLDAFTEEDFRP